MLVHKFEKSMSKSLNVEIVNFYDISEVEKIHYLAHIYNTFL